MSNDNCDNGTTSEWISTDTCALNNRNHLQGCVTHQEQRESVQSVYNPNLPWSDPPPQYSSLPRIGAEANMRAATAVGATAILILVAEVWACAAGAEDAIKPGKWEL